MVSTKSGFKTYNYRIKLEIAMTFLNIIDIISYDSIVIWKDCGVYFQAQ